MRSSRRFAMRGAQSEPSGSEITSIAESAQENQQKSHQTKPSHSVRLVLEEEELGKLESQAAEAGLSVTSYILTRVLGAPRPRMYPVASGDEEQAAWKSRLERFDDNLAKEGIALPLLTPPEQPTQMVTARRRPSIVKFGNMLTGALFRPKVVVTEEWGRGRKKRS